MKKIITAIINAICYVLSLIIPKSKKIVVCGGWFGNRFADNSKAFFLYLSQNKDKLGLKKVVYVANNNELINEINNEGYFALKKSSLKSLWFHLRARFQIVDQGPNDVFKFFSIRAKRINLWHGFPLKKIGYLINKTDSEIEQIIKENSKNSRTTLGGWNKQYLLALSDEQKDKMSKAFAVPKEYVITGIYPRIEYLKGNIKPFYLNAEKDAAEYIEKLKLDNKKVIFYLPTFRDDVQVNNKLVETVNALDEYLKENDIYMITKMHFAADINGVEIKKSENIINLIPQADVYNFLGLADLMVTDYSSVYFDYMLLNRPIVFYCFDIDYYVNSDRGFLYDYNSFTPGEKAKDLDELKEKITYSLNNDIDKYKEIKENVEGIVYGGTKNTTLEDLYKKIELL